MEITGNTKVGELIDSGEFGLFADYFWSYITEDHRNNTLGSYGFEKCGFVPALQRVKALADGPDGGRDKILPIYTAQEMYECHEKDQAKLLHFPVSEKNAPYALIIPGGGFARQWGLIEGMAIAERLNRHGYACFVLYYRTAQHPVIDKALEDVYRAISYLDQNADALGIRRNDYILGGFSAGATLAGEIASDNLGWHAKNLPRPRMIFLGYTAGRMDLFYQAWAKAPEGSPARLGSAAFLSRLVGENISLEALEPYCLEHYLSRENCPPLYLVANEDDPVVPFVNSQSLRARCEELSIPVRAKFGRVGGHSFGVGDGLEVAGWIEDMLEFLHR